MKETKSIQVDPKEEQSQIDLWQRFGWELQSSQEILNRSEGYVKDFVNYVKLVFLRDTERTNYREINKLEREYDKIVDKARPSKPVSTTYIAGDPPKVKPGLVVLGFVFYIIPGIIYLAVMASKRKAHRRDMEARRAQDAQAESAYQNGALADWKEECAENNARRAEILRTVSQLL